MAKRSGLGKGLDALFLDNNTEDGSVTNLKISEIEPNKHQPRVAFDEEALRELADSIRVHGVIQPLVVRPMEKGGYQIVAGERRWRAARMAGLSEVPVVIRQLDDNETLEIAIIENLQREDLNPIELALGYQALMDQYGLTQEQVAQKLGKSRSVIANTIRLLKLPSNVQKQVQSGKIPPGHAKALLSLEDDALIEEVAQKIVSGNVLVRDIEKLARERKTAAEKKEQPSPPPPSGKELSWGNNYMKEMELALSAELGRSVRISSKGKKYTLELDFYSEEELADIAARLTKSNW
ncbi:MAG TPA: ParB/RepB/Spo0J family partition protein [Clostridiales bacterium]|nr:ParB/RepB/Spo0J family partition protein [Clostridiales bacterium]